MGGCESMLAPQPASAQVQADPEPIVVGRTNRPAVHKVVILGTSAVGKSSIMLRYMKNTFAEDGAPTLAAAFFKRVICIEGVDVPLHIWDTSGDERCVLEGLCCVC
jgi:GTPase SAR1 family protein